jgi:hypothetical protein
MEKIRYELDPRNRLVIDRSGLVGLPKFRQVLDGRFRLDENNDLSYHIKAPLAGSGGMPNQLKLRGEWSLTDNHDLRLTLDKEFRNTFGDQVTLHGEILDVDKASILFAVTTRTKSGARSTYILNLEGAWKADENNRLSFHVRKESGRNDVLTFNGAWEIGGNHGIVYQYEKADLSTKRKRTHALRFKGYWDIKDEFRISYVLGRGTDSVFDFSASAGIFKEDRIEYELGISLAGRRRPVSRTITLYGKWNLKNGLGLSFAVEYEGLAKTRAIVFDAEGRLTDRDTVIFRLKNQPHRRWIDAQLELSRRMLKGDGEAFIRLLKAGPESVVYVGSAYRW